MPHKFQDIAIPTWWKLKCQNFDMLEIFISQKSNNYNTSDIPICQSSNVSEIPINENFNKLKV